MFSNAAYPHYTLTTFGRSTVTGQFSLSTSVSVHVDETVATRSLTIRVRFIR